MDCGATCLYMVSKYYGREFSLEKLRFIMFLKINFDNLIRHAPKPAILHWGQKHFIVLPNQKKAPFGFLFNKLQFKEITIADPARGVITISKELFLQKWISDKNTDGEPTGIALLLEPGPNFYNNSYGSDFDPKATKYASQLLGYIRPHKKLVFQLFLGVVLGSILQLVFPFLTQSVVDVGINTQNLQFVYIVLFAQLALFIGRLSVEFIRSWILFHISSRINITILTGFLIKLMRLPLAYFDSKKTGDILQRMNDHKRIQNFLTGTSLNTLFSLFNLLVFSIVLLNYNLTIFCVFIGASVVYIGWIILFLQKRKLLDYQQFEVAAAEQSSTIQLLLGMQEIKLHGSEKQQRWQWEHLQAKLFRLGIKGILS